MDSHTYRFEDAEPAVHPDASVSREATLVGDVAVAADATVWPGAVLRGDVGPVDVGEGSAIGDNAVLHASQVGAGGLVGHAAVLNDTEVEDEAMVGFNTTASDAVIGARSIVAMGTVIPGGYEVPPDSFARGNPARVSPLATADIDRDRVYNRFASGEYAHLHEGHQGLFE